MTTEDREKKKLIEMLIKLRKDRRYTQMTMAAHLGIGQSRLCQIELGNHKITLDLLLQFLGRFGYDFKIEVMPKNISRGSFLGRAIVCSHDPFEAKL